MVFEGSFYYAAFENRVEKASKFRPPFYKNSLSLRGDTTPLFSSSNFLFFTLFLS